VIGLTVAPRIPLPLRRCSRRSALVVATPLAWPTWINPSFRSGDTPDVERPRFVVPQFHQLIARKRADAAILARQVFNEFARMGLALLWGCDLPQPLIES
jgi:hypothetical protein